MNMEGRCIILVLARKKSEAIRIGLNGEIKVIIVEIRHDVVRLGIEAPQHLPVHRQEVFAKIQAKVEGQP